MSKSIAHRVPAAGAMLLAALLVITFSMAACEDDARTVREANESAAATATPATTPPREPTDTPTAIPTPETGIDRPAQTKRGFSSEHGVLSPYVKPEEIDGAGRKLLAIYMVGSDLEEDGLAGSIDLEELIEGYNTLPDSQAVEVIVAFGGADKDGWRGMKFANASQLLIDYQDLEFGNETGSDAYLYRADGAHMGDESSLSLFLDYLRDGYVNFDQRFLALWDHGNSYKGFGNDTNFNGDGLSLDEISGAFRASEPGKLDLIGFDACLMASVEVAKVVEPHAEYMIASEAVEPGHGWFWTSVIESFAQEDSIVEAGKGMVDDFVQNPLHADSGMPKTLSLLDLTQYDNLMAALNPVLSAYGDRLLLDEAYAESLIVGATRAESYGESEREDTRASVDLRHFIQLLSENPPDADIGLSLVELTEAVDRFVVHSNHDGSRPNSFGIAIDAPENADTQYSAYKINDTWLDFQSAFNDFLLGDHEPPEIIGEYTDSDGTFASVYDANLARVTALYGFVESVEFDDGSVEDYFMVVAEEPTQGPDITELDDVYLAFTWNQWWFTVEYDPGEETAWIPAFLTDEFELDGLEFKVFAAEIDYYQAGKDYSRQDEPYDFAKMSLIVHDDGESWEILDHYIETYQVLFSGPDDEEGFVQYDKATFQISPGDKVEFLNYGFSLEDPANDQWFYTTDGLLTFVQEPVFQFELLEFEDQYGELLDYYYAIWAEDASGNATLSDLTPSARVVDSPFGNMQVFVDPSGRFEVQRPQIWIEEVPDASQYEVFRASDLNENGSVTIYVEEDVRLSLAEYADALETGFLQVGAEDLTRESVFTAQGLPAILFEWSLDEQAVFWLAYVSDDGVAIDIAYGFPADQLEAGGELAYYSFETFRVRDE